MKLALTTALVRAAEEAAVGSRCAAREAALIIDEVFADYPLDDRVPAPMPRAATPECLLFRLGGLSKSAGLPQVKLGWMSVDGPDALVADGDDGGFLVAAEVDRVLRSLDDEGDARVHFARELAEAGMDVAVTSVKMNGSAH